MTAFQITKDPCINGHYAERNASGLCKECNRLSQKRYREKRSEKLKDGIVLSSKWSNPCQNGHTSGRNKYGQCLECVRGCTQRWQSKNRHRSAEYTRKWRLENPERNNEYLVKYRKENKEDILLQNKKWREKNPDKWRKSQRIARAKRRACKPKWVDNKELREIYNNCPDGYQVDHIIPVNGKTVCGLHVPSNLQYLTPKENRQKGNSFG